MFLPKAREEKLSEFLKSRFRRDTQRAEEVSQDVCSQTAGRLKSEWHSF